MNRKLGGPLKRSLAICLTLAFTTLLTTPAKADSINLRGTWSLALDPDDVGQREGWAGGDTFRDAIQLPGSLQEQGFGVVPTKDGPWTTNLGNRMLDDPRFVDYTTDDDFGNPFWLTPKRMYVGAAWYQREVEIPAEWRDSRIELFLERPHWGTTVYVDGIQAGSQHDALGTPHVHDLTDAIREAGGAGSRTITVRVDNSTLVPVGLDAHAITDQTQSNWNGIVGAIELRRTPPVWISSAHVFPSVSSRSVTIELAVGNTTGRPGSGEITFSVQTRSGRPFATGEMTRRIRWTSSEESSAMVRLDLGDTAPVWTEFDPNVLELHVELGDDRHTTTFGLREITVVTDQDGSRFAINDQPVFLRGTLECAVFPETGYPPTDVASWRSIYQTMQAYGLNHVRFHSWCPPRAAFDAADELGIYVLAEASTWPNFQNNPTLPGWLEAEGDRMLREYGNHPSFVLMGVGNEFWDGGKLNDSAPMIEPAIDRWRDDDTRRYYTTGAGWPQAPANDFHITQDPRLQLYPGLRLSDPPRTDLDYRDYVREQAVPIVTHEIGQWCAFPDLSSPARSNDVLEARYLEMFKDALERAGLGHLSHAFTQASGEFQELLYKAEIEAALRTPGLAGFQLLGLPDFPGQGVAPVGVLDHNWQSKGYSGPSEYQRFCADRVILARMPARTFERSDAIEVRLDLANYGEHDLQGVLDWKAAGSASGVLARGSEHFDASTGGLTETAVIRFTPSASGPAERISIEASVRGTTISNDWPVWIYPAAVNQTYESLIIAKSIDADLARRLEAGETAVVMSPPAYIDADTFGSFRPIFWNTILFTTQREHTLGALIDHDHPALAGFPTDTHVDWQWWDVLFDSKPIPLDGLSSPIEPIVRPIDDWVDSRSLGLIFEARVGDGRLLICAADLESDLDTRPAARALRRSLLDYASSDAFDPQQTLQGWELIRLFREPSPMQKLGAAVIASNSHQGYGPELAIDGDPSTFWHTAWSPTQVQPPHSLEIDLGRSRLVNGMRYTPRADQDNGRFAQYRVETSPAGYDWSEVATGTWANNPDVKTITWDSKQARYIKLTMITSANGQPYATAAEVEVLVD